LQQAVAQLGPHFRSESRTPTPSRIPHVAADVRVAGARAEGESAEPDTAEGGQQEDLFIFTVKDISLAKGERMVVLSRSTALRTRTCMCWISCRRGGDAAA
jgi:hypothetical protein